MKKYQVVNVYGIRGTSNHATYALAKKEAYQREGDGWLVVDIASGREVIDDQNGGVYFVDNYQPIK